MNNTSSFSNTQEKGFNEKAQQKPINIGQLFRGYLSYWTWFLITFAIGLIGAFLYIKYTDPVYSSSVKVLITDDKTSGQLSETSVFEDLGISSKREQNTENEIEILRSTFIMQDVVQKLGLQYKNIQKGSVRDVDLYKEGPIQVLLWAPKDSINGQKISFLVNSKPNEKTYSLTRNNSTYLVKFGDAINLPEGKLILVRRPGTEGYVIQDMIVDISDVRSTAVGFIKKLTASVVGKKSTVLKIDLTDIHPLRSRDILNEMVLVYDASQVADKNRVMKNTLSFIDERILILSGELGKVEGDVEQYKSNNQITSLSAEGELLMQEVNLYNKSLTEAAVQNEILTGINDLLRKNPEKFEFVPTNAGITNLVLAGLLQSFNELLIERDRAKATLGPNNPTISMMESQLSNLRLNILSNIGSLQKDLTVTTNNLKRKEQYFSNRLGILPRQERELIEIQRQQGIKQNLYLYLLQKREETALNLAVAVGNNRVIEPATIGSKIKPKPEIIWVLGLLFGLIVPISIIGLLKILNNKVWTDYDIAEHTNVSIIGSISFVKDVEKIVVREKSRSAISEMFRLIRANLQFIGEGIHNKVILITSSTSGEGKSFISVNLGLTIALAGKKVMMLELDMRKPKLAKYLGHTKGEGKGITQYLVKDSIPWQDLVNVSTVHNTLHYISTGPIPPNPSELLLSKKLKELIEELKKHYDYIIMDSPPVGLVSDALLLGELADTSLYIVRQGKTIFPQLGIVEDISVHQKLPRPFIIFNSVRARMSGYGYSYGYGYGYGNGYGYGYYQEDKKSFSFKNLFRKMRLKRNEV